MKKRFILLFISAIIFTHFNVSAYASKELDLSAETAVLIDSETGDILYDKDSSKVMFPADTTKILTAIIAIENSDLTQQLTIDEEAVANTDEAELKVVEGEVFSMVDLLHLLLLSSDNGSAVSIAKQVSGSVEEFSKLMNTEAKKMGATNSNFLNPTGYHDENHVSTAHDLAMISKYAMKNDIFRDIVKKPTYSIKPTNKTEQERNLENTNKMLYSDEEIQVNDKVVPIKYDGTLGVKTGYTESAEQCFVSSVNKSDREYISVILKSLAANIYIDTHKLFDHSPNMARPILLAKKNEFIDNIAIKGGDTAYITAVISKDFKLDSNSKNISNLKRELIVKNNLKLPISKGQVVGKVNFKDGNKVLGSVDVISINSIVSGSSKGNSMISSVLSKWWFWVLIALIVIRATVGVRRVMYRASVIRQRSKKVRKKGQTSK